MPYTYSRNASLVELLGEPRPIDPGTGQRKPLNPQAIQTVPDGLIAARIVESKLGHVGIVEAPSFLPDTIAGRDIAQTRGAILRVEFRVESEILCIDGVVLWDFDYIDLGRIRMPSYTVPVTIKSLVFSEEVQGGRPAQRIHHHDDHDHDHGHSHGHGHHHHGHDHAHGHSHSHDHKH